MGDGQTAWWIADAHARAPPIRSIAKGLLLPTTRGATAAINIRYLVEYRDCHWRGTKDGPEEELAFVCAPSSVLEVVADGDDYGDGGTGRTVVRRWRDWAAVIFNRLFYAAFRVLPSETTFGWGAQL